MFETFFYQPILNLLVFFYNIVPGNNLAIAIILLTATIKLALWPLSKQALQSQKNLQELQPEMERLKKEHANNKEELGRAMMWIDDANDIDPKLKFNYRETCWKRCHGLCPHMDHPIFARLRNFDSQLLCPQRT